MFAFDGICKIASLYYAHLGPYMDALFGLTTTSVGKEEAIAVRAIEFWNVICEVEIAIFNGQIETVSQEYVKKALHVLVPLVTSCMTKQVSLWVSSSRVKNAATTPPPALPQFCCHAVATLRPPCCHVVTALRPRCCHFAAARCHSLPLGCPSAACCLLSL